MSNELNQHNIHFHIQVLKTTADDKFWTQVADRGIASTIEGSCKYIE
jgi:hypothetical protein